MLARGNTEAARRLRKAKSTSSVPRRVAQRSVAFEDPETTQRWALTAATRAFEKAAMNSETQRSLKHDSRGSRTYQTRRSFEGFNLPKRQQSFCKRSRTSPSKTSRYSLRINRPKSAYQLRNTAYKTSSIPSEQASTIGTVFTTNDQDLQLAARYDGYGVPAPPYQRKTESSSSRGFVSEFANARMSDIPSSGRHLSVNAPAVREYQTDEAIIALARNKYLEDNNPQLVQKRHSFISDSIRSRMRRSQRFSWQTTSTNSQGALSTEPRQDAATKQTTYSTNAGSARAIISTIKHGWRKVFQRPTSSVNMPTEHMAPSWPQRGKYYDFEYDTEYSTTDLLPAHEDNFDPWLDDKPPTPPPHLEGLNILSRPNHGYLEVGPVGHMQHESSRVTSWDDSTRQSTVASHDFMNLPSIKEDKESSRRVSEAPTVRNEPKQKLRRSSSRFSFKEAIDSRRLLSALMKHTGNNFRAKESEVQQFTDENGSGFPKHGIDQLPAMRLDNANTIKSNFNVTSDVRDMPLDLLAPQSAYPEDHDDERCKEPGVGRNLFSPSIYSDRDSPTLTTPVYSRPVKKLTSPVGTATVIASEAVTRWPIGQNHGQNKQSTSNEWRTWAADEVAGFDAITDLTLAKFGPVRSESTSIGRSEESEATQKTSVNDPEASSQFSTRQSSVVSCRKSSKRHDEIPSTSSRKQHESAGSQSDMMNERFPKLIRARDASKSSLVSSWRIYSPNMSEGAEKLEQELSCENENLSPTREQTEVAKPLTFRSYEQLGPTPDKKASRIPRLSPTPKAVASNPQMRCSERKYPLAARASNLDENTLLRIRKGPYNNSSLSIDKDKNDSPGSIHIQKRRSPGAGAGSKENTPPSAGRRMAEEFLESRQRRGKAQPAENQDSSPAFI